MRTIFALAAALGLTAGAAAQEPADSAPAPADSIAAW